MRGGRHWHSQEVDELPEFISNSSGEQRRLLGPLQLVLGCGINPGRCLGLSNGSTDSGGSGKSCDGGGATVGGGKLPLRASMQRFCGSPKFGNLSHCIRSGQANPYLRIKGAHPDSARRQTDLHAGIDVG